MESSLKRQLIQAGYKGEFDLSSLIEACGDGFGELHPQWWANGGRAYSDGYDIPDWDYQCEGNTPEEAVARLYLALNK